MRGTGAVRCTAVMGAWGWVLVGWVAAGVALSVVLVAVVRLREAREPRPRVQMVERVRRLVRR